MPPARPRYLPTYLPRHFHNTMPIQRTHPLNQQTKPVPAHDVHISLRMCLNHRSWRSDFGHHIPVLHHFLPNHLLPRLARICIRREVPPAPSCCARCSTRFRHGVGHGPLSRRRWRRRWRGRLTRPGCEARNPCGALGARHGWARAAGGCIVRWRRGRRRG